MTEKESVFRQPLGEVMRREINTDFLHKELTADFLKKEIHFRKKHQEGTVQEAPVVPQVTCFACKKETPSTVSACLHCGAHMAVREEPAAAAPSLPALDLSPPSRSLIDIAEDIL